MTPRNGLPSDNELLAKASHITLVPIREIDRNPIQAPQRTESGIDALKADILQTGFVKPIIAVRKRTRYTAIDGHRRMAAMERLGRQMIPVMELQSDHAVTLLFLILNRSSKLVNAAQLFFAWGHEAPDDREQFLKQISGPTKKNIRSMVDIFGLAEAVRLADGKLSPHIAKFIHDAQNILIGKQIDPMPLKQIGRWVIAHAQTGAVNRLRRNPDLKKSDAMRLRMAIEGDRPLQAVKKRATSHIKLMPKTRPSLTVEHHV